MLCDQSFKQKNAFSTDSALLGQHLLKQPIKKESKSWRGLS